jgi:Domain of unknown function (DUF1996)
MHYFGLRFVVGVALVVASVLCVAVFLFASRPVHADIDSVFNVNCPISHFASDDPIVFPGQAGASHRHAFYANISTGAHSTTESLLASPSTCERGFDIVDRSSYWVPTLYRVLPGGTKEEVHLSGDDQHLSAYYRRAGGVDGDKIQPFPKGLRMLTGDPKATSPQSTQVVSWRCHGNTAPNVSHIPSCGPDEFLQAEISFPDCWDGKNLDSANHRSHMASSQGEQGKCPASHPVKVPQVLFEISFKMSYVQGAQYELSSGGQYSMHADFFAAWDDRFQSALVNSCLNAYEFCENIKAAEVNLAAASSIPSAPEPAPQPPASSTPPAQTNAHGSHDGHAPVQPAPAKAVPVAAQPRAEGLPAAGAGALIGLVAATLGAASYGVYHYRHRLRQWWRTKHWPFSRRPGDPPSTSV